MTRPRRRSWLREYRGHGHLERRSILTLWGAERDGHACVFSWESQWPRSIVGGVESDALTPLEGFGQSAHAAGRAAMPESATRGECCRCRLREERIGALYLFRMQPGRVSETEIATGQALADIATIGILQEPAKRQSHEVVDQLQGALTSRVVIEQGKGLLSERAGLEMTEAFERLRTYARNHNRRLAEVAQALLEGAIPTQEMLGRAADQVCSGPP